MLCEVCGKETAKVHVTQIKKGKYVSVHLCQECARTKGMGIANFSVADLLTGFLKMESQGETEAAAMVSCKGCGQSFSDFKQNGRLGCNRCYYTFESNLKPLIKKIQKSQRHTGKVPRRGSGSMRMANQLRELRRQLTKAVEQEEFEIAARLRDQIYSLEKELAEQNTS